MARSLAVDLQFWQRAIFKAFRQDQIHLGQGAADVLECAFSPTQHRPAVGAENGRALRAGSAQMPGIRILVIHLKPMGIVLDGGDPHTASRQRRDQSPQKRGLACVVPAHHRHRGRCARPGAQCVPRGVQILKDRLQQRRGVIILRLYRVQQKPHLPFSLCQQLLRRRQNASAVDAEQRFSPPVQPVDRRIPLWHREHRLCRQIGHIHRADAEHVGVRTCKRRRKPRHGTPAPLQIGHSLYALRKL